MYITIGILTGVLTGALNFFIFEKQMKVFLSGKKWYLIIAGYIIRYTVIGVVFYFSVKKSTPLFLGVLIGFFITQLVFFSKKARSPSGPAA
jgi:hypothetical protein